MEKAIKKAIEGGYDIGNVYNREMVLLNPQFWQALGKADGWSVYIVRDGKILPKSWLYYWHNFIDHIADGGSVDDFFNNLIK